MDNRRDLNSKLMNSDDKDSNLRTPRDGPRYRVPEESKSTPIRSLRRPLLTRIMPGCRQPDGRYAAQDRYAAQYRRSQKEFELYLNATRVLPLATHEQKSAAIYMPTQGRPVKVGNSGYPEQQSASRYTPVVGIPAKEGNSGYTEQQSASSYTPTQGKHAKEGSSGYSNDKPPHGNLAKVYISEYTKYQSATNNTPTQATRAKGNDLGYIEHQGFFDTVRPGIWSIDMAQFEPPRLDIADQIKLKRRLEAYDIDSNDSGSYSTEIDTLSYEESFHYSDMDMVEDLPEPEERPRRGGRLMRFFRRLKKALF